MAEKTLLTRLGTDLDTLRRQSILIGTEGPDIRWYVLAAPDDRWIAWDDSNPNDPKYTIFASREEAIDCQHSGYRAAYPDRFSEVKWISVNQITDYRIDPAAIRKRIRLGQWPLGHARWAAYPTTSRWEVTDASLTG